MERLSADAKSHVLALDLGNLEDFDYGTVASAGNRLELFFDNAQRYGTWPTATGGSKLCRVSIDWKG